MSGDERTPLLVVDQENAYENTTNNPPRSEDDDGSHKSQKASIIALLASSSGGILMAALDTTVVTTAYARIGSDMGQLQRASWIATSYMMAITAFQPMYGKLSDIFGRKSCLLFAHLAFGIGCLVCALANSMWSLVAARMLSGMGGAGLLTVVTVAVSDIVPYRQRGTWQGIINLIYSIGTGTGAPLGGVLVDAYGWRWGFLVQVPICILGFIAISFVFPKIERKSRNRDGEEDTVFSKLHRVDFLGSFLLIVTVFSLSLGLDYGSNVSWATPISFVSLTVAVLGIIGLGIVESNPSLAKEPVAPIRFFKNRNIVVCFITPLLLLSVGTSTIFQLALYAQVIHRKSASQAGVYLVPIVIGLVIGNLLGGILLQKMGKFRRVTILSHIGVLFFASIGPLIAHFRPSWDLLGITISLAILSFFAGISSTTLLVALIASVDPSDQASATAVSFLFRTLGQVIGMCFSYAILQQILRIDLTREFSGSPFDVEEFVRHVRESLGYIDSLEPAVQVIVRRSYSRGLVGTFGYGTLQSALSLLAALFIRDRSLDASK